MRVLGLIFTAALLPFAMMVNAQQQSPSKPVEARDFADAQPMNCAHRGAVIDVITQNAADDDLIIVIARLGDGDLRPNLNRRRLHNVSAYWTKFLNESGRRKPETIILAEGEKVKGYGQLEFYVGGKLIQVLKVKRNADLYVGECYPPDDSYIRNGVYDPCWVETNKIFYPCRDRRAKRR